MKQIHSALIAALLLAQTAMTEPSAARGGNHEDGGGEGGVHRGGGGHAFPGAHFAGAHAGYANHYDNYGRWGRNRYAGQASWDGWARPRNRFHRYGWGGWYQPASGGAGYAYVNREQQAIDEEGNLYPAAPYNVGALGLSAYDAGISASQVVSAEIKTRPDIEPTRMKPVNTKSVYKLGPDVDILESGNVAVRLNDDTFLLVDSKQTLVVNQKTGVPAIALYTDPLLLFNIAYELKRQSMGLHAAMINSIDVNSSTSATKPSVENMEWTLEQLQKAKSKLGPVPDTPPKQAPDPVPDAIELFASVWLLKDGSYVLYKQLDGSLVYMDSKGTFADRGKTARQAPYPDTFELSIYGFLKTLIADYQPTMKRLAEDKDDTEWALSKLNEVNETNDDKVETAKRLEQAVARSERRLGIIDSQLNSMPDEVDAAKKALSMLEKT